MTAQTPGPVELLLCDEQPWMLEKARAHDEADARKAEALRQAKEALANWNRWAEDGGCDLDEIEEGSFFRDADAAIAAIDEVTG